MSDTCPNDDDTNYAGFRITELTVFTVIGDDDEEGIPAFMTSNGQWMPLVAADPHRLEDLRAIVARQFPDMDVRERRFVPVEP